VSAARDLLAAWRAQRARATVPEHADMDAAALAAQAITGGLVGGNDDPERRAMQEHYAEPPSDRPYKPSDADGYRDGLLTAALQRPPSWTAPTPPTRGCWCSYCGTPQSGGRWWRPRHPRGDGLAPGEGWRCMICRPIPPGCEVEVVET
jgi:hypothetical protein